MIDIDMFEPSYQTDPKAALDKYVEGGQLFSALIDRLLSGYAHLRNRAEFSGNMEKMAYYQGIIDGLRASHGHWIELSK